MDGKQWAEKIVQVQSGLLTATEAARQLGVSRKTYYKRENRALSGLMAGVEDRESGRPANVVDEEKDALNRRIEDLEKEVLVLQQTLRIREVLGQPAGKEKRRKRPDERPPAPEERENRRVSGQGTAGDRESSGKLEGVLPSEEDVKAEKPGIAGSEGHAGDVTGNEYGLEKKRVRQDA